MVLPSETLRTWLTTTSRHHHSGDLAGTPQVGDFVVYSYRQTLTLIRLALFNDRPCLEEACIQKSTFQKLRLTWPEWQDRHFPKALYHFRVQWPASRLESATPRSERISARGKRALMPQLLAALWTLPFQSNRQLDQSPPLFDSLIVDGRRVEDISLARFCGTWPDDRSALSGRPILLSFATLTRSGDTPHSRIPLYWPVSLQVGSGLSQERLSAVDFGTRSPSPSQKLD